MHRWYRFSLPKIIALCPVHAVLASVFAPVPMCVHACVRSCRAGQRVLETLKRIRRQTLQARVRDSGRASSAGVRRSGRASVASTQSDGMQDASTFDLIRFRAASEGLSPTVVNGGSPAKRPSSTKLAVIFNVYLVY
jgi:hypothetical protein